MVNKYENLLTTMPETSYFITYEQMNTIITFQRLWNELAIWMRFFVYSAIYETPNASEILNRLYRVGTDFYYAISVFYGPEVAQTFVNLLSNFITNSCGIINSMKIREEAVNAYTSKLYENADTLAKFLSQINPYWDENQWRYLLYKYIKYKIEEIVSIMIGNYQQEIAVVDELNDVTAIMGSYMARGIIAKNLISQTPN